MRRSPAMKDGKVPPALKRPEQNLNRGGGLSARRKRPLLRLAMLRPTPINRLRPTRLGARGRLVVAAALFLTGCLLARTGRAQAPTPAVPASKGAAAGPQP